MSETVPESTREPRFLAVLRVLAFVLAISAPGLGLVLKSGAETTKTGEALAPFPATPGSLEAAAQWPTGFKAWFRDRFEFRRELIRWNALLKVRLLGVSSSPKTVVGREGWLFYADERGVEDFRATAPFTTEELAAWRAVIQDWGAFLSARGIPLILVVAPNKPTVYPEYVPRWMTRVGPQSRLEQLYASLAEDKNIELLDIRPALADARKLGVPLYFRTDTHWNDLGAYVAFREIAGRLAKRFPGVSVPPPVESLQLSTTRGSGGDLARFLGLHEELEEEVVSISSNEPRLARFLNGTQAGITLKDMEYEPRQASERPGAPIGRAVIFRDSFANALLPRLAELFGRGVYVWTTDFDYALVEQEKPDVVIVELIERVLMRPAPRRAPMAVNQQ
ncbi:alginate O-acetyltransferase AlgX-related protein [Hyalangium gracile]|uniref:alginate O-acetyltransferase AlgX-related protein n=1 Tax=Hyalangium gracile TaxID=394092 RepID=UPI001CCDB11D|nr:hypothetical protein [Hyalangium gracile]